MLTVTINQEAIQVPPSAVLLQALEVAHMHTRTGIAVAVNNKVIPKANWAHHLLQQNDKITIITATQGG